MAFFCIDSIKSLFFLGTDVLIFFCNMLQALSSEDRKQILHAIADALEANEKTIRAENELDVAAAQEAGLEESLVARLVMTSGKVRQYSWWDRFLFFVAMRWAKIWCQDYSLYEPYVYNVSLFCA